MEMNDYGFDPKPLSPQIRGSNYVQPSVLPDFIHNHSDYWILGLTMITLVQAALVYYYKNKSQSSSTHKSRKGDKKPVTTTKAKKQVSSPAEVKTTYDACETAAPSQH